MSVSKMSLKSIKPEFYATKLYLSKLSEKYKSRGYEKIFLEKDSNFLSDIKDIVKKINNHNDTLADMINDITKSIQKISKLKNLDSKVKKILVKDNVLLFAKFLGFIESIIKNEDVIMESIDRFRKIEKEIDIKAKALTDYGFNKELTCIFDNMAIEKHKEITVIIFDMNNLKTLNESYGHQTGQEAIYKFGNILKEELNNLGLKYIISNYFGGDERFLCLIDVNKKNSISLVTKFFQTLNNNRYKIRDFDIKLSSCAGVAHYHPPKTTKEFISPKTLINIADTLLLQSKLRKNRNKSGNAYKVINITNITNDEIQRITKNIQTAPKKLKRKTLDRKKLLDLFNIRKAQNENIMRARTLGVKRILRDNIDLINEIIGNKIIESIGIVFNENKSKTFEKIDVINRKIAKMVLNKIEKKVNGEFLCEKDKKNLINKIIKSAEVQKFTKYEIGSIYETNIFNLSSQK